MKKLLYLLLAGAVALQGCSLNGDVQNPDEAQIAENERVIEQYLTDTKLQLQKSASGLRYKVSGPNASGKVPQKGDQLVMAFVGRLVNGTVFDSVRTNPDKFLRFAYNANAMIPGINETAGYMKQGDSAKAVMPFYLGLGSQATYGGKVPGYSVLVFDMKLVAVQTQDEALQDYIARKKYPAAQVVKTSSGLYFHYLTKKDTTATPVSGKTNVSVKYKGMFLGGGIFDQTTTDARTFAVNGVIAGFREGLNRMRVGEKAVLMMPSSIGYGDAGSSSSSGIPGFTPLVFEVEVTGAQ